MNEIVQFAQQILKANELGLLGQDEQSQMLVQLAQATLQGDLQAAQLLALIALQMQQELQALMARRGTKLNYIKMLRGLCPEGTELQYFKAGGHICKKCVLKLKMQDGSKMPTDPIEQFRCGKRMKKKTNKINKGLEGLNTSDIVEQQRLENERHAKQADYYLHESPSIGNLARGVYHWYMSKPMLGGHSENGVDPMTGEAPIYSSRLTSLGKVIKTIDGVNYYKAADGTLKTAKEIVAANKELSANARVYQAALKRMLDWNKAKGILPTGQHLLNIQRMAKLYSKDYLLVDAMKNMSREKFEEALGRAMAPKLGVREPVQMVKKHGIVEKGDIR